ncbi:nucleotidyltransferase domain-containing protein [Bacillus sp. JJ1609]|uniref:nucleotidyltransferase domain-containing protein n=1 Tax=Bacillus sp. JJ1609 TaxID=3122977 RepID=UPI003000182B
MRQQIIEVLKRIELEYDVKILFACDAGSRALGFADHDSDYDIRFIYVHKLDWYLSIDQKKDVLEVPKQDALSIEINPLLDMSGWELTKTLRLYRKSNPSLIEWLQSKEIYLQQYSTIEKMKAMTGNIFSAKSFIIHHINIAKRNFDMCLGKKEGNIKLYLYILRSILTGRWIEKYGSVPPVEFQELIQIITPGRVKEAALKLLSAKLAGDQHYNDLDLTIIDDFIVKEIDSLESYANQHTKSQPDPTNTFNQLFRDTLKEVWT